MLGGNRVDVDDPSAPAEGTRCGGDRCRLVAETQKQAQQPLRIGGSPVLEDARAGAELADRQSLLHQGARRGHHDGRGGALLQRRRAEGGQRLEAVADGRVRPGRALIEQRARLGEAQDIDGLIPDRKLLGDVVGATGTAGDVEERAAKIRCQCHRQERARRTQDAQVRYGQAHLELVAQRGIGRSAA